MGHSREATALNAASVLRDKVSSPVAVTARSDGLDCRDCDNDSTRSRASREMSSGFAATGSDRTELGAALGRIPVVLPACDVAPWERDKEGVARSFLSLATQSILTLSTLTS